MGVGRTSTHAFGPKGWFEARGCSIASVYAALRASGALRSIPVTDAARVAEIYADPLRNRAFAFLDAVLGPKSALVALDRLVQLDVGIVGCGGIGSSVTYLLAGMGVKRFRLVDPDVVEQGNLSRQVLYTLKDIGCPKVETLARALRSRFKGFEAIEHCSDALSPDALTSLSACDVIICAGDDPPTLATELHLSLQSVPIWTCGYALGRSIVRPPKATARAARSSFAGWFSIPGGFAPSIGFQNMEIAAACVARMTLTLARGTLKSRNRATNVYELDYTSY